MINALLPPGVVAVEAFHDDPAATLFPAEAAVVAGSVDKRRAEFTTGRVCARRALVGLGLRPSPILPGPRREPLWPAGVVGSITHCAGYRAAAVAWSHAVTTLGIDAEPHAALPDAVLGEIAGEQERAHLGALARAHPEVHWDRLLFSAKESVYKAWFPLARRWLGFDDAHVVIEPDTRRFTARLLVPGPFVPGGELTGFTGRWIVDGGLLATAIVVVAGDVRPPADGRDD